MLIRWLGSAVFFLTVLSGCLSSTQEPDTDSNSSAQNESYKLAFATGGVFRGALNGNPDQICQLAAMSTEGWSSRGYIELYTTAQPKTYKAWIARALDQGYPGHADRFTQSDKPYYMPFATQSLDGTVSAQLVKVAENFNGLLISGGIFFVDRSEYGNPLVNPVGIQQDGHRYFWSNVNQDGKPISVDASYHCDGRSNDTSTQTGHAESLHSAVGSTLLPCNAYAHLICVEQ